MKKTLITIEGTDGSGKQTQSELLYNKLLELGYKCMLINFPDYDSPSSTLVKMYLAGDFGAASEVGGHAASMLYAADRFASYKGKWKNAHDEGVIIIADRYVSSNLIHQTVNLANDDEKAKFADWLYDTEFVKFGIPKPSMEIFLDMPPKNSMELTKGRLNKITGNEKKDILEADHIHLQKAYDNALSFCESLSWNRISCVSEDKIRSIDNIHKSILDVVMEHINDDIK